MDHEIENQLIKIIQNICQDSLMGTTEQELTADTDIQRDLGFDSILLVVLQIQIEDAFHMRFNAAQDDLRKVFTNIGRIRDYIEQHIGA